MRIRPLRWKIRLLGLFYLFLGFYSVNFGWTEINRNLPNPLPKHPGNIFLEGEQVTVDLPGTQSGPWRLLDYENNLIKEIPRTEKKCDLGSLPTGFYRLELEKGSNWTSLGVISPLQAPTPLTSPIGLDVAMAWFYSREKMDSVANLCALAGVNWVRDRLNWAAMEPQRNKYASSNQYDAAIEAQHRAGLQILQVYHSSPSWANPKPSRFPLDLRDAYRFHREMAHRWEGKVMAFEPWNEADIPMFGGHTGMEMASLQKAAWLGLKAGNPNIIACLNVFAMRQDDQLLDLGQNEAWPYFDTFNLHHYAAFNAYAKLYAAFRAVSAGKPLWVTECNVPVKWSGDAKLKEPAPADLREQTERVGKVFAHSIQEGSAATFYFMLPHYAEGQTQFGLLRPDLTPRPAFLALAAVGRLMADAAPLGQWKLTNDITVFFFKAKPDGLDRDLLVAWSTKGDHQLELPATPEAAYDLLGRKQAPKREVRAVSAPQYFLFPPGTAARLISQTLIQRPPKALALLGGHASPIVFQLVAPTDKIVLKQSCYRVEPGTSETFLFCVYNFGSTQAQGQLRILQQGNCKAILPQEVEIAPGEKKELTLEVSVPAEASNSLATVHVRGDFGELGKPVLSARFKPEKKN